MILLNIYRKLFKRWSVTPVNIAVRIAFITILLCGCLIFWHWKAGLISNLSVVKYDPPFNSLEGIMSTDFKVGFRIDLYLNCYLLRLPYWEALLMKIPSNLEKVHLRRKSGNQNFCHSKKISTKTNKTGWTEF